MHNMVLKDITVVPDKWPKFLRTSQNLSAIGMQYRPCTVYLADKLDIEDQEVLRLIYVNDTILMQ